MRLHKRQKLRSVDINISRSIVLEACTSSMSDQKTCASVYGHLLMKFCIHSSSFRFQIILFLISTASCAQLNNNYLPPANAQAAGGTGLKTPKGPGGGGGGGGGFGSQGGGGFVGANVPIAPSRPGVSPPRSGVSPPRTGGAAPAPAQASGPPIEIVSYENVNNGDGSYKWRFGT